MIRKPISRITSVLIGLRDGTSLRQQIALLAASLCILSIAVAAFGAALIARGEAIRENRWDLTLVARSMAQRLDQTMFDRYREVRNVADMELLKPVWTRNPDIVRETLDQLQRSLPQ